MSDSPNETGSNEISPETPPLSERAARRRRFLEKERAERAQAPVQANRSKYTTAVVIGTLTLLLTIVTIVSPLSVSPPRQESESFPTVTRWRQQQQRSEERLANNIGFQFGSVAGIWGGSLLCTLLFLAARPGLRTRRPAPTFALYFGLAVQMSLGGLAILWMSLGSPSTSPPPAVMRGIGAALAIAGAVVLGIAIAKPRKFEGLPHPSVPGLAPSPPIEQTGPSQVGGATVSG